MGERFTKKEAKTGNTRMLTVDETNDQETNDQVHEKKDSENLNDRTEIRDRGAHGKMGKPFCGRTIHDSEGNTVAQASEGLSRRFDEKPRGIVGRRTGQYTTRTTPGITHVFQEA